MEAGVIGHTSAALGFPCGSALFLRWSHAYIGGAAPRLGFGGHLMSSEQKVAIVTGASQGIGASLVKAYRDIGYGVVANSRSIKASDFSNDPAIATVAGDIAS